MILVLDTATLLYVTFFPDELSQDASRAIATAEKLVVSSISIWEIGIKIKKGKLVLPLSVEQFVEKLGEMTLLEIVPVTVDIWLANLALVWPHRNQTDRTIVATAQLLGASLGSNRKQVWTLADHRQRTTDDKSGLSSVVCRLNAKLVFARTLSVARPRNKTVLPSNRLVEAD